MGYTYRKYNVWSPDDGHCCWLIYIQSNRCAYECASVTHTCVLLRSLFDLHKVSLKAFGRKQNEGELNINPHEQISHNMILQHILNSFENSFELMSEKIFWSQSHKIMQATVWMVAVFSLFATICTQLFSINAGHHINSVSRCVLGCAGDVSCGIITHWRLPSCHWATISLCGCFFLRVCTASSNSWSSRGNSSKAFNVCKCTRQKQVRLGHWEQCACVCVSEFLCFYTWMCHPVLLWTIVWKRPSVKRLSLPCAAGLWRGQLPAPP